jgi:hypothetical protein
MTILSFAAVRKKYGKSSAARFATSGDLADLSAALGRRTDQHYDPSLMDAKGGQTRNQWVRSSILRVGTAKLRT